MHFYMFLIFPITGLLVAGYVTHYCASGSQGGVRTFGKILSAWVFLLALFLVAAAVTAVMNDGRPFGIEPMHGHFYGHPDEAPGGPPMGAGMMNAPPPAAPESPPPPSPPEAAPAPPPPPAK